MKWPFSAGKTVFVILIGLTLIGVVLLSVLKSEPPEVAAPPEDKTAVTVHHVEGVTRDDQITLPGRVEVFDEVVVAAEQSGRVVSVQVREGRPVSEGDALLQIDDSLWQKRLQDSEIRQRDAQRDLSRMEELLRDGAVSQSEWEAVQTAAETAEIALAEAKIELARCTPIAPLSGTVEQVLVSTGEYVNPGQPVVRILETDRMKVVFFVPERDVLMIRSDRAYGVELASGSGDRMDGTVHYVASSANPANNAYRVELVLDNAEGRLRGGMMARVQFHRGTIEDAVVLPLDAIVPMEGEFVVYIVQDDRAVRRIIRMGQLVGSSAVIREGVAIGDLVVRDGNRAVIDGTPVVVKQDWEPAPMPE